MPYKRIGSNIYHKKDGKWVIKQQCKNVNNAKAALRLLESLENKK